MTLAQRLTSTPPSNPAGLPCSIGALLARLDGDERDALLAMLGTPEQRGWSQRQIWEALQAEGYEVGMQTVNRHRSGQCRCGRGRA